MEESAELHGSKETAVGDSHTEECRRGPGWKGWVLSILVAVILSVTTTFLLCGSGAFRSVREVATGAGGSVESRPTPSSPGWSSGG